MSVRDLKLSTRSTLPQNTERAPMHPTRMLLLNFKSMPFLPMNAKIDPAAISRFKGTKNTPMHCHRGLSVAQSICMHCQGPGAIGGMLTEIVPREVAGSKLVLDERALAHLA
eukprot:scaffold1828_cov62-Phaeocystis_antarctica.AAC.4